MNGERLSVLFAGYAPVHFLCFEPLFERLAHSPGVDVFVSGGLRTKTGDDSYSYDARGLYGPLGIPEKHIVEVADIQERRFHLLFSASKRLVLPRANVNTAIQIFHGMSFRNRGVREENLVYDFFFTLGPYMERKFAETGLLAAGDPRMIPVGFPKTDPLVDGSLNRDALIAIRGLDTRRPVVLYAPTGQSGNSLETMGLDVLDRLGASGRYQVLVKLHDHPKNAAIDWHERIAGLGRKHVRVVRDHDIIPLLFMADLLITDASSVCNEYALLDRPIVFLDVPELLAEARSAGAALDLDTWGRRGGGVVGAPEEIADTVARGLADPTRLSSVRREMAADLFHNPGRATAAAWRWLDRYIAAQREAG